MSDRRAFTRNLVFSGISAVSNVFALLLLVYATGRLSIDEMGILGIAFSFANIGEPLMDFGIQQATLLHVARNRSSAGAVLANSIPIKAITGAAMLVTLSAVAFWRYPTAAPAAVLMLFATTIRSYLLSVRGVLQGLEQFGDEATLMLADRVLMLAGGVLAIHLGYGIPGLAFSFVVTRSVSLGLGLVLMRRHVDALRVAFDYPLWAELRAAAVPLGLFGLTLSLYNYVDVLILGDLTNDREVGLYHNGYKIYEALTYASGILASVLTPRYAALWTSDRAAHAQLARRGLSGAIALSLMLAPIAWWLAPTALRLFYGADYVAASRSLRILTGGVGLIFAIWILHAIAMSASRSRLLLQTTLVSLVVNITLNYALIPAWHRDGAAAATVAGEAVGVVILLWGLRDVLFTRQRLTSDS